jgi:HSP20 family protein
MLFNTGKKENENLVSINFDGGDLEERWFSGDLTDGQLLVDVYTTDKNIIIKSAMAGTKPEDLNISLHNDLLTIKGKRENEEVLRSHEYLYKECYWGSFSRSLVLPAEVDSRKIEAYLENGVLTIVLTKIIKPTRIKVEIKE